MTEREVRAALRHVAHEAKIDVGRCTAVVDTRMGFIDVHIAEATEDDCTRFVVEAYKLLPATIHIQATPR